MIQNFEGCDKNNRTGTKTEGNFGPYVSQLCITMEIAGTVNLQGENVCFGSFSPWLVAL
jgi:hypothetical protein